MNPPERGWIKYNFDASLSVKGYWGLGFIFMNNKGEILTLGTKRMKGFKDLKLAEAIVLKKTLEVADDSYF